MRANKEEGVRGKESRARGQTKRRRRKKKQLVEEERRRPDRYCWSRIKIRKRDTPITRNEDESTTMQRVKEGLGEGYKAPLKIDFVD